MNIAGAADYNNAAARAAWPAICDATLTFDHPDLVRLLELWRDTAGENGIPQRRVMSPRVLKPFLRDIAIYECLADGDRQRYRVRLMGTSFAQIMGDLTGKYLDAAIPPEFVPRWHASLDATLGARAPLRFLARGDTNRMDFLVGEYFSAPLAGDEGQVNLVLAAGRFSAKRSWEEVDADARRDLDMG